MFGSILIRRVLCIILLHGLSSLASDPMSVKEGNSVTLCTDVNLSQNYIRIIWYFKDVRIAQISGVNNGETCPDDLCKERFSGRLKLHHQTGSLTIKNTRTTDSGEYKLTITGNSWYSERIINVSINGGADNDLDELFVMEGDSVPLHADVSADNDNVWYYNESRIAHIRGDRSKICTDAECKERFGDRLKLDNQTSSLIIMNIRKKDAGPYKLTTLRGYKVFRVVVCGDQKEESVTSNPGWNLSFAAAGATLLFVAAVIIVIVLWRRTHRHYI